MGLSEIEPAELASSLREVQKFDTEILGLRRDIAGLEDKHRLGELSTELDEARASLAQKEAELAELELKQHKLDGELDLLTEKMSKEEEKMMSGTIMNPKELASLQAEIFALRKKRDEMETEDLEEMVAIDGLLQGSRDASKLIEEVSHRLEAEREAFGKELQEKEEQVARLEADRDRLKVRLDPDVIERYEKLLNEKDGIAVVEILQGRSCGGCRIEFSRTQIDRFQHEEGIFRCEYCRRILVK